MLLTVVTATIAVFLTNLAVVSLRAEGSRASVTSAVASLDSVRAEFEKDLAGDPYGFLRRVQRLERPRRCLTGDPTYNVAPLAPWPAACGAGWSYDSGALSAPAFEIVPPSPSSNRLTVRFLAPSSEGDVGVAATYLLGGRRQPSVFSGADLDTGRLAVGDGTTNLSGLVYASGSMDPSGESQPNAVFAAEEGFVSDPSGRAGRLLSGVTPRADGVEDIRTWLPRFNALSLTGSFTSLRSRACPDVVMSVTETRSSHACFTAGASVTTASGVAVTVPAGVTRYLLWPGRGTADSFDVWVSTSQAPLPAAGCGSPCDVDAFSEPYVQAGTHPATLDGWDDLGRFNLPFSGVVAFDRDVHVGACSASFLIPGADCDQVSVQANVTVLVGSRDRPADLWLAAPVVGEGGNLGAAVSGRVRIPFWSHAPGGSSSFDVSLVVLGADGGDSVSSFPDAYPQAGQQASSLTLTGVFAASRLSVSCTDGDGLSFASPASLLDARSPYLPGVARGWVRDSLRRLSAVELQS